MNYNIYIDWTSKFLGCSGSRLFVTLVEGEASRRLAIATVLTGTNTHDMGVDSTGDTIMVLNIGLGDYIL